MLGGERSVAVDVNLCELKLRLRLADGALCLAELTLRLRQRGLEGTRVDLEEDLAFLYDGAFAVVLLDEVAGDLRLDVGVDEAVERANPFVGDGDIRLLRGDDLNGHGAHCAGGCSGLRVIVAAGEERGGESDGGEGKCLGKTSELEPVRSCTTHPDLSGHAAACKYQEL